MIVVTEAVQKIGGMISSLSAGEKRKFQSTAITAMLFLSDSYNSVAFCDAIVSLVKKKYESSALLSCQVDSVVDVVPESGSGITISYQIKVAVPSSISADFATISSKTESAIVTAAFPRAFAQAFKEQLDFYDASSSVFTQPMFTMTMSASSFVQAPTQPNMAPLLSSTSSSTNTENLGSDNSSKSTYSTTMIMIVVACGCIFMIIAIGKAYYYHYKHPKPMQYVHGMNPIFRKKTASNLAAAASSKLYFDGDLEDLGDTSNNDSLGIDHIDDSLRSSSRGYGSGSDDSQVSRGNSSDSLQQGLLAV
jgi:hypothetical protein